MNKIISLIIIFIISLFLLTGCSNNSSEPYIREIDNSRFEIVEFNSQKLNSKYRAGFYTFNTIILRDKVTNVLYLCADEGFITPMIDSERKATII